MANEESTVTLRFCPACGGGLTPRQLEEGEAPLPVCEQCSFVLRLHPRVVGAALFLMGGGLVLVRRADAPVRGLWSLPGGYVHRGESVVAAAVRETLEETGLHVRTIGVLDVYSSTEDDLILIPYAADLVGGESRPGKECLEVSAFAPERLPWDELAFESMRPVLRDYLRRFFPRVRASR